MKRFKLLQFIGPGQRVPPWYAMAIPGCIVIGAFAGLIARLATASKSEALVFAAAILASALAAFCSASWIFSDAARAKRFQLLQFVGPGQRVPPWYAMAWYDWVRNGHYALPIPLALPSGVARWLWAGLRTGSKAMAIDARVAYLDGIQQGIHIARKDPSLLHRPFAARGGDRLTIINADTYDQRGGKR